MREQITGHTKMICLLGSPVAHSISPMMHNESFKKLGLDYVYLAFDVGTEGLKEAVDGLKAMGARGFNLTMPDKNLICEYLDELSPAAKIGGAVNTVVNDHGVWKGYTTDGCGFTRAVREAGYDVKGRKITLAGAGGAGVAIMIQAALEGAKEISLFNRKSPLFLRAEKIREKLAEYSDCKINLYELKQGEELKNEIFTSTIFVNATSVGMAPNIDQCIIEDDSFFHKDLLVFDAIYNPEETLLLKKAKASGCMAMNGLNMLLYQGAEAFRLWTGQEMPVELVREKYFTGQESA